MIFYGFVSTSPDLVESPVQSAEKLVAVIRAPSRCFTILGEKWNRWFVPCQDFTVILPDFSLQHMFCLATVGKAQRALTMAPLHSSFLWSNDSVTLIVCMTPGTFQLKQLDGIQPSLIWLFTPGLLRWHVKMYAVKKAAPAVPRPRVPTRRERHEMMHKLRGCSYDRNALGRDRTWCTE